MIYIQKLTGHFLLGLFAIAGILLLTACPEEEGNELDTSLFIKNTNKDSLRLRLIVKTRLPAGDSTLSKDDVDRIYSFQETSSLVLYFDSLELREFPNSFSSETIEESPIGMHLYLMSIDTLEQYTPETWDRQSGMKQWYLFSLDDYESINYTLDFP
ncbi:MAG: hypothetical protein WBG42_17950 [Cryomorphaceae bacterium]